MNDKALLEMIDEFLISTNPSIALANEIEVTLDESFPDNDFLQDTVVMLALFLPGGGEHLFATEPMQNRLRQTKKYLLKLKSGM